jgi:hypothetical protein
MVGLAGRGTLSAAAKIATPAKRTLIVGPPDRLANTTGRMNRFF